MDESQADKRCDQEFLGRNPQDDEISYDALLKRVGGEDWLGLAQYCQTRYDQRTLSVRRARREDIGIGVAMIYEIQNDRHAYDRFAGHFEQAFGREIKPNALPREVFLLLYGEQRKASAGTDAMAMRDVIRRRIPPERIPRYIERMGGIERLLKAERARKKPWRAVEFRVYGAALERLNTLQPGECVVVRAQRNQNIENVEHKFAITRTR